MFFDRASYYGLFWFTKFNAQFLYSLTICMLHYNPRHVSSINMPIFRRTNCIITASGTVTLCKRLYSMSDESRLCPSSGGQIVLSQHLVSSLSVNGCTVCRKRADSAHLQEDKSYYHSIWYCHSLYSTVQYAGWEQTLQSLLSSDILYSRLHGHVDARYMSRILM